MRPILEVLDNAQKKNKVGMLSDKYVSDTITANTVLARNSQEAKAVPQKVIVQSMPKQAGNENASSPATIRILSDYADTMRLLRQRLDEPFVTVNSITGDMGIKQAQDEYDKLIRNKTPKSRL